MKKRYFEPEINICRLIFAQDQLLSASQIVDVPDIPEETVDEDIDIDD